MTPGELPIVVVADAIAPTALERLRSGPCQVVDATEGSEALLRAIGSAWGIIVRSRTKVTRELLAKAPALRFIGRAGVGVDNIDMDAAWARGIEVVNAPSAATTSVAELTLGLLVALARDLYPRIADTKAGGWKRTGLGSEIAGKTVGFVGYGRIAREVARRLGPFGVTTIAYDPFLRTGVDATALVPLDDLLARSDFVSLHAASTAENHHLLDRARLARMKPGAYLLNLARGALVDEGALLEALDAGRLAGAALDVFENEPPTLARLVQHPRLLATPHLGASTHEGQTRAGLEVVEDTLRALAGKPLQGLVSPPKGAP
ncbi:MAG: hydroxyacid dehydrogenase [Thermoplasmata archaeon]|nr:hydroxyacid dehydrogenase [Thermoplasmata archaeon]